MDWTAVERERGIPVSEAAMSFEHEGLPFDPLDTPGDCDVSLPGFQQRPVHQQAVIAIDRAAMGLEVVNGD